MNPQGSLNFWIQNLYFNLKLGQYLLPQWRELIRYISDAAKTKDLPRKDIKILTANASRNLWMISL